MPTYEYQCRTCETRFDVVQSFADDALTLCPQAEEAFSPAECVLPGEGVVKKVFSVPAITFKGDGFYKTDSRKAASNGSGRAKSDDAGAEGGGSGAGADSAAGGKASSGDTASSDSGGTSAASKGGSSKSASKSGSDSKKTPASV